MAWCGNRAKVRRHADRQSREAMLQQVPLKRIGQGREVAEVVRFLAGDGASYVTGQTIHVNGGLYV